MNKCLDEAVLRVEAVAVATVVVVAMVVLKLNFARTTDTLGVSHFLDHTYSDGHHSKR